MLRPLLVAGALLALMSPPAHAAGLELAWNACYGQAGAAVLRTSGCDTNDGAQSLFASFRPPGGVTRLEGIEVFIDFSVKASSLPCWWNLAAGQPRVSQLTPLHVSPTDANGVPLVACDNHYFLDRGAGGGGGMVVTGQARGQLRGIAAIAAGTGEPVAADAQQYAVGFRIANGSTMPPGTCDGCANAVCLAVYTINLTSFGLPNVVLQSPHPGSQYWVNWQRDDLPPGCHVPVLQHTWGQIKGIYR